MASRKASRLLEDPPSASPSQEHEEEEEEEVEEEKEEELEESLVEESVEEEFEEGQEEETPEITKLSQMPQNQHGEESSEDEEGYETDNDNAKHSPTASSFIVKPAVNKNNHSKEPVKPKVKRALINAKERKDSSKKTKVVKDLPQEDKVETPKKGGSASGRVWSSEDAIAILGGMIDYQKQKGAVPQADMMAFLEFVKGRFGFEVTRTQLYEKVRSLKKKFVSNLGKGENFIPTKPHDIECFELSKKIWGANNGGVGGEGNSGSNANDVVVSNGVDHTEHVKIIDGHTVTKKSANGKSSEGKRKEKGEKKKKVSEKKKKKKMDHGTSTVEKEVRPVIDDDDVVNDTEDVVMDDQNVVENDVEEPVTDEDVTKIIDDVVKDYEIVTEKEAEPVTDEDVRKDKEDVVKEDVVKEDENIVEDTEQNIMLKYPNLIESLSHDMPESQRKIMKEGLCLIDREIARELEDRWKELLIKEGEFHIRKMELMLEQSKLLVAAVKQNR